MSRWKNATSYYICNLWLTTVQNIHWKISHCLFSWIFNDTKIGKKPNNSKNCHFSPIFDDKLVNLNMKSQTRHKDIMARQSKNTSLSTGNNEKLSCLGLQSWIYKFSTENGAKDNFCEFSGFCHSLGQWETILKRNGDIFQCTVKTVHSYKLQI